MDTYEVNSRYSRKAKKIRAWRAMGLSQQTAEKLYKLYGGSDKKFNQMLVGLYGG